MAAHNSDDKRPGFLFMAYAKAKAALGGLGGKGRDGAEAASQRPRAGEDWKAKTGAPPPQTAPRAQEEMKESLGAAKDAPDNASGEAPGSGDAQKRRGEVELPSGTSPRKPASNPAAPAPGDIARDETTAAGVQETGEVPQKGLGLDDGPHVKYSSDTGQ